MLSVAPQSFRSRSHPAVSRVYYEAGKNRMRILIECDTRAEAQESDAVLDSAYVLASGLALVLQWESVLVGDRIPRSMPLRCSNSLRPK